MTLIELKWIFWGCIGLFIAYRAYNKYQEDFNSSDRQAIEKEVREYLENEDKKH